MKQKREHTIVSIVGLSVICSCGEKMFLPGGKALGLNRPRVIDLLIDLQREHKWKMEKKGNPA